MVGCINGVEMTGRLPLRSATDLAEGSRSTLLLMRRETITLPQGDTAADNVLTTALAAGTHSGKLGRRDA